MKRILLALAIACLSASAYAVPPGPPSIGPVDVNVVSPVPLPVMTVPPMTALNQFLMLNLVNASTPSPIGEVVLKGFIVFVDHMATTGTCFASVIANEGAADPNTLFSSFLYAGEKLSMYVPLPDLYLPEGTTLIVKSSRVTNECYISAQFHMIRQ